MRDDDGALRDEGAQSRGVIGMVMTIDVVADRLAGNEPLQFIDIRKGARFLTTNSDIAFMTAEASRVTGELRALLDRDILQFFLIGLVLFGLGIVGEYVGRIYLQVRDRPRYVIDRVVEQSATAFPPGANDIESSKSLA